MDFYPATYPVASILDIPDHVESHDDYELIRPCVIAVLRWLTGDPRNAYLVEERLARAVSQI
jgi:hypothetical protein